MAHQEVRHGLVQIPGDQQAKGFQRYGVGAWGDGVGLSGSAALVGGECALELADADEVEVVGRLVVLPVLDAHLDHTRAGSNPPAYIVASVLLVRPD